MEQHRAVYRMEIQRDGQVRHGEHEAPCTVLDLSERGVLVSSDLSVAVGDEVVVRFPLTPEQWVECLILITHASFPQFGGTIAAASSASKAQIDRFLRDLAALDMTGF